MSECILAFDSSAEALAVSVMYDGAILAEHSRWAGRPRSEHLLALAESVLAEVGRQLEEVTLLAVATGPGSFNGIRGGIAVVEGLAMAREIPAVGVSTLDVIAYAQLGRAELLCALLPAGRGDVYSATYSGVWENWHRYGEYTVASPVTVLDTLPPGSLLCGALSSEIISLAQERHLIVAPAVTLAGRASYLAALARMRATDPAFNYSASLQPLYLRRPGITTPKKSLSLPS